MRGSQTFISVVCIRFGSRHGRRPREGVHSISVWPPRAVAYQAVAILLISNTSGDGASVDDDNNDDANGSDNNGGDSNMPEQHYCC